MYGRNAEFGTADLSSLTKATLIQICLGAYDLGLIFDGPVRPTSTVMITSSFGIELSGQQLSQYSLEDGHLLRPFLNREIASAAWGKNGTLVLTFDNDEKILVFDDSDQYESYTINLGSTTIVI
jgi:hypothetical protein